MLLHWYRAPGDPFYPEPEVLGSGFRIDGQRCLRSPGESADYLAVCCKALLMDSILTPSFAKPLAATKHAKNPA